jgi:hypothetical protein
MWVLVAIVDNGLLLPVFQPEVPGDLAIVFIEPPVALFPAVKLAAGYPEPTDKPGCRQLSPKSPVMDEIDNRIPGIVGDPDTI